MSVRLVDLATGTYGPVEQRAVASLRPGKHHPPLQRERRVALEYWVARDGFDQAHPLTITDAGQIIEGHHRYAAAVAARLETVPCRVWTPGAG